MFENLKAELRKKNISMVAVARTIHCSEKSIQNKINGSTEFTLSEILAINEQLLPEFDLKYLFRRSS